jgi:hypothetical protein
MPELNDILPQPVMDELTPSMIPDGTKLRLGGLTTPVPYEAFEAGRERFAWLRDPSARSFSEGRFEDTAMYAYAGSVHWFLLLRRRRSGWRVEKAHVWDSEQAARQAAAMEWAGRQGYLVDFQSGQPRLGPRLDDIDDPVRYLDLARGHKRKKVGGSLDGRS